MKESIEFDKWLTSEAGRQALIDAGGSQAQAMHNAWNAGQKRSYRHDKAGAICLNCSDWENPDVCIGCLYEKPLEKPPET